MKHLAAVLLCMAALPALGQVAPACLPGVLANGWAGSQIDSGVTRNGAWVRWYCYNLADPALDRRVAYVGTLTELSKVGARVQTILKSPDPLKSLQTAGARFPILPLADPSLAAIVADMRSAP